MENKAPEAMTLVNDEVVDLMPGKQEPESEEERGWWKNANNCFYSILPLSRRGTAETVVEQHQYEDDADGIGNGQAA